MYFETRLDADAKLLLFLLLVNFFFVVPLSFD